MAPKLHSLATLLIGGTLALWIARDVLQPRVEAQSVAGRDGLETAQDPRLDGALERLGLLEERLRGLEGSPLVEPVRVPSVAVDGSNTARTAELEARVAALEARLERGRNEPLASGSARPREPLVDPEQAALEKQRERLRQRAEEEARRQSALQLASRVFGDAGSSQVEKVEAQSALRRIENAYSDSMVTQLIEIGLNSPESSLRADVWRNFDGETKVPALIPHLLSAIQFDTDSRVRSEATETLANYADDPLVLQRLRDLAENDADGNVRRKAQRELQKLLRD